MGKRFCPSCGNKLELNSNFCNKCGFKVEIKQNESITKKKMSKGMLNVFAVIIIIVLLILFLVWLLLFRNSISSNKKDSSNNTSIEEKKLFNGHIYPMNEGYGWIRDESNKFYYLVNKDGKIIIKVDYTYYGENPVFKDGYSQLLGDIYDTSGKKVLSKEDKKYDVMNYVGKGLVVIKITEENYKGTSTMMGIYDLNKDTYNLSLKESILDINYLEDGMFLININGSYLLYNSESKKLIPTTIKLKDLIGVYKDGYVVYKDNNYKIYLLDKNGDKHLIYSGNKNIEVGQYSNGLVYIENAFYNNKGNKVIDLKGEGVKGSPEFVEDYALIFFKTGYFTILSKSTKNYTFTPRKYTSMSFNFDDDYELGLYEGQTKLTKSGHILVKTSKDKKVWAIMDYNGEIVSTVPVGDNIFSGLSDSGYLAIDGNIEDYYMTTDGKVIKIDYK